MPSPHPGPYVPSARDAHQPRRHRRPVIDPTGTLYPSLMAAAQAHDIWPSAIHLRCSMKRGGWRFADETQEPAPTPPSAA
jgi:hypothetical protein